jgi:hypothetical protein
LVDHGYLSKGYGATYIDENVGSTSLENLKDKYYLYIS